MTEEVNVLGAIDGQLYVLQHLAFVQFNVQNGLHAGLAAGFTHSVIGEGPHSDGADQADVNAFFLQLGDSALGDTRHGAEGSNDVLSAFAVVAFPHLLVGNDFLVHGLQLVIVDSQALQGFFSGSTL